MGQLRDPNSKWEMAQRATYNDVVAGTPLHGPIVSAMVWFDRIDSASRLPPRGAPKDPTVLDR